MTDFCDPKAHVLKSEEECEQFHRPSSSPGSGLVNMACNVVLTLSRNQPISRAQSPVLPFVLARLERLNANGRSGGGLLEVRGFAQREVHFSNDAQIHGNGVVEKKLRVSCKLLPGMFKE